MKRAIDLKPPAPSSVLERCEADRFYPYANDNEKTDKQCKRAGRFLIDGRAYCRYHAGAVALKILIDLEK